MANFAGTSDNKGLLHLHLGLFQTVTGCFLTVFVMLIISKNY